MSKIVSIQYSPQRWRELSHDRPDFNTTGQSFNRMTPTKIVTIKFESRAASRESRSSSPRKEVVLSVNLQKKEDSKEPSPSVGSFSRSSSPNVEDSIRAMSMYQQFSSDGNVEEVEQQWINDITHVAKRLHFLRESYRVVQSIHRKKIAGKAIEGEVNNTEGEEVERERQSGNIADLKATTVDEDEDIGRSEIAELAEEDDDDILPPSSQGIVDIDTTDTDTPQ